MTKVDFIMKNKLDLPKIWRNCALVFLLAEWLIVIFVLDISGWYVAPIFIIYLIINAVIFNSYFLGIVGNFYFVSGRTEKAFKYYRKAIAKKTRNVSALYAYGIEILKDDGKATEALALLQRAEKFNAKVNMDKNIRLAISSCYWVKGDIDKAIDTLERLKRDYNYVNAHVYTTLGYFYILKEDFEKAMEYSNLAIEDQPEHSAAWDNIGQIYFRQENFDDAKAAFIKALKFKETMVDSLYYLGCIYEKENEGDKAFECFSKAKKCNISSLNTITKEQILEKYRKYDDTEE